MRKQVWAQDGKLPLHKKGQGQSLHASGFVCELELLKLSPEQIAAQANLPESERLVHDASEIIRPGKNADGWWNAQRLIAQVSSVIEYLQSMLMNNEFRLEE